VRIAEVYVTASVLRRPMAGLRRGPRRPGCFRHLSFGLLRFHFDPSRI